MLSEGYIGSPLYHDGLLYLVDQTGYLYVVDRLNQRVLRYFRDGTYVQEVNVEKNSDNQSLLDPVAIGVDDSLAYVADFGRSQVIRYKRRP